MTLDLVLPAVIALVGAAIPATIGYVASRTKGRAEAENLVGDTYHQLINDMADRMSARKVECEERIAEVERRLSYRLELMALHIGDLEGMIRTLGGHPPDRPRNLESPYGTEATGAPE